MTRLDPQPTDTALARCVARLVAFVSSTAPVWMYRNLTPVRRGSYDDEVQAHQRSRHELYQSREVNEALNKNLRALERDYRKLLPALRPNLSSVHAVLSESHVTGPCDVESRVHVSFEDQIACVVLQSPRNRLSSLEVSEYTKQTVRKQAQVIAQSHTDELAEKIAGIVEARFNTLGASRI